MHLEAIRFAKDGYTIVLIGHEGHDEVIGTMGEAPEAIVLVESPEEVDRLELSSQKLAYLTQTTLSVDDANRIIARLKAAVSAHRRPAEGRHLLRHAKSPGSGAAAVERGRRRARARQPEQLEQSAAGRAGRESGVVAHLIDGPDDIDMAWFSPDNTVLVTAGASAAESVVEACVKRSNSGSTPRSSRARCGKRKSTFRSPRNFAIWRKADRKARRAARWIAPAQIRNRQASVPPCSRPL